MTDKKSNDVMKPVLDNPRSGFLKNTGHSRSSFYLLILLLLVPVLILVITQVGVTAEIPDNNKFVEPGNELTSNEDQAPEGSGAEVSSTDPVEADNGGSENSGANNRRANSGGTDSGGADNLRLNSGGTDNDEPVDNEIVNDETDNDENGDGQVPVPQFPTLALPIVTILAMFLLLNSRKG